ncbi:hypothetical protein A1O1_02868 [Capronia coronata CBS 617.96]|uniref:Glucose-methanol-choline oxidoreductase N-terminal domain-containing protein n=1 Tax=Capronia coronata CBS 617.96 TaxID=1182541 RepID=W9YNI6_9EURO|nr:uncharacterized protein A1O1_02868 [Capronia coronata CBS 617.96]EXJ94472.1 hypothetical protein A1O1_02868 [Capronia coronata CBS 617.96]
MGSEYDFIIVGAGASGCPIASRLARSAAKPSVLLLEAGTPTGRVEYLSADQRFAVASNVSSFPNWGYKTTPQNQLAGQEVDYSRGKGLGGTTCINYCGWLVGPSDDYNQWARLVGDQDFAWANAKRCLDKVTHLHPQIPRPELKRYIDPDIKDHSDSGVIDLTYGGPWIPDIENIFIAAEQVGISTNKDVNSGNPIGLGMGTVCCIDGKRITAAKYLEDPPSNLTIVTGALVAKVLLEGKKARGLLTDDGRVFSARCEVIISGGALNSPQLLLLSGIGPRDELEKHDIPVQHELNMVGKNLEDHCFSSVGVVVKHGPEYHETGTPLCPSPMAFLQSPAALRSPEYARLPSHVQKHLETPTVPHFEIATHSPPAFLNYIPEPEVSFVGAICLLDNPQSRGSVRLRSASPNDAPIIDPKFLTNPYDRRVMIDGVRQTLRLLTAPVFAQKLLKVLGPADDSDEAIWEHIRTHFGSSWHMASTVRMGTSSDTDCVDSNFKVFGIEGLRVVDMSVCPFVPNNHCQSTAYVLGEIAAEKLIKQYNLDTPSNTLSARL